MIPLSLMKIRQRARRLLW